MAKIKYKSDASKGCTVLGPPNEGPPAVCAEPGAPGFADFENVLEGFSPEDSPLV